MNLIFRYMKPHFPRMVVGFMVKFSGTVMDLLLPWILAYIIDEVVPEADIARVVQWGLVMVVCAFIAVLGNVTANRMASSVARDSMRVLRNDTFTAIMNLSCGQVDNFSQSTLISRMTSDTYNIHQIMNSMQRMGVRAPILLIGGIIVTMTLDPVLSAILASTLPFLAIVVIYVAKKGIPLYNTHQKASDVMIGRVRESITGIRVIKALSKGDYERERFENINLDVVEKEKKAGITMALTNPVMNFLLNVGWVMIIFVGAVRVNAGLTAPGKIIAFLTYFTIILNAMLSITRLFVMFSRAGSSAERIEEILQARSDIKNQDANDNKSCDESLPYIVFDNVSFSYNGNVDNLSDISFSLEKGQKLGIIGATGSGKTTIINLLMRFYDVSSGKIFIDGKDIFSMKERNLTVFRRRNIGFIFQSFNLIPELTVEQNIIFPVLLDYQKPNKKYLEELLTVLGLKERRNHLPSQLSGGQQQRVAIGRALITRPALILADEPTGNLDTQNTSEVIALLKEASRLYEQTIVMITHSQSIAQTADRILQVSDGVVTDFGRCRE